MCSFHRVALHERPHTFLGLNSAAAKPGEPSGAAPGAWAWRKAAQGLSGVSRSEPAGYGEGGVTFLSSFIHLLITFCQILWG